jgi:hypothetical protein
MHAFKATVQQRNGETAAEHPKTLNAQLSLYKLISLERAVAQEIETGTRNEDFA